MSDFKAAIVVMDNKVILQNAIFSFNFHEFDLVSDEKKMEILNDLLDFSLKQKMNLLANQQNKPQHKPSANL